MLSGNKNRIQLVHYQNNYLNKEHPIYFLTKNEYI